MQPYLDRLLDGEDLTIDEARTVATAVFEDATEAQIGALLAALRLKGETEAEIAGFAQGMFDAARTIDPDARPLLDIVGTGGDAHDTINVSTTSSVVAAGAGATVAKHGNYSVSSPSGSADVLDAVGMQVDAEPEAVRERIEADGLGFMLAPVFHPAMKAVIGPRKELGVRTIFNVLGPLTNPANAERRVVGVYDPELVPILARAMARMDVERAMVVHGSGLDEIAVHDETTVAEVDGDRTEQYTLEPADVGVGTHDLADVLGGTPEENAADLAGLVRGERNGAKRDIVLANAGAGLYVAGHADSHADGVELAAKAIDDGDAADVLDALQQPRVTA
ncbi:MAG: anthranilate phosphoribosyltransferase [Halobacteriales archaeon]|nr:anthranilate phosphoribosyltransferase [Halobacteriales archaeon]